MRVLENPATGETYGFARRADETDGEVLALRWSARPGGKVGEHVHPHQEERFAVTIGVLTLWISGRQITCRAGQTAIVPAGVRHRFANLTDTAVHAELELRPALRMEQVFEALAGFGRDGLARSNGLPRNPLLLAVFAQEFRHEIRGARPPAGLQRALLPPLALLGRAFGNRAYRPEYRLDVAGGEA